MEKRGRCAHKYAIFRANIKRKLLLRRCSVAATIERLAIDDVIKQRIQNENICACVWKIFQPKKYRLHKQQRKQNHVHSQIVIINQKCTSVYTVHHSHPYTIYTLTISNSPLLFGQKNEYGEKERKKQLIWFGILSSKLLAALTHTRLQNAWTNKCGHENQNWVDSVRVKEWNRYTYRHMHCMIGCIVIPSWKHAVQRYYVWKSRISVFFFNGNVASLFVRTKCAAVAAWQWQWPHRPTDDRSKVFLLLVLSLSADWPIPMKMFTGFLSLFSMTMHPTRQHSTQII